MNSFVSFDLESLGKRVNYTTSLLVSGSNETNVANKFGGKHVFVERNFEVFGNYALFLLA